MNIYQYKTTIKHPEKARLPDSHPPGRVFPDPHSGAGLVGWDVYPEASLGATFPSPAQGGADWQRGVTGALLPELGRELLRRHGEVGYHPRPYDWETT